MRRLSRRTGTSLVDVTGALVVVVTAVLASAVATIEGASLAAANETTRATTRAMTSLLDEARTTPFDRLDATFEGVSRTFPLRGSVAGATVTFALAAAGGTTRWPVRRLSVNLAWNSPQGPRTKSSSVLLCDRAGTGSSR